jgi:Holliday junction DNA helicase RuvB
MGKKGEIENLLEGEEVIYKTGLHKFILIWPSIVIIVFFVLFIIALSSSWTDDVIFLFDLLFLISLILWVVLTPTAILKYSRTYLYLTNKRIIYKVDVDVFRKASMEILFDKVDGIGVDQSILGRMLNYGILRIKCIDTNNITVKNVRDPYEFRRLAQEQTQNVTEEENENTNEDEQSQKITEGGNKKTNKDETNNVKYAEKNLLLSRLFDEKTLLAIGKEIGDEYCNKFNEKGFDKDNKYVDKYEVAKRLSSVLTDSELVEIFEKDKDHLRDARFVGKYYTYASSKAGLELGSMWHSIKEEIYKVYDHLGDLAYSLLKAFLTTPSSSSPYGNDGFLRYEQRLLLYNAEALADKSCKKALDGLRAIKRNVFQLQERNILVPQDIIPLIEEIVSEIVTVREESHDILTDTPKSIKLPADLFDTIIGYEDVKDLYKQALKADKPFHILLVGPPASAKTVFLLEIERLPGSCYALGSSTSKSGLTEYLLNKEPRYLLIDEMDKMSTEDYGALLSLCETGDVIEIKYKREQRKKLNTWVFAAANAKSKIPKEVLSRFQTLIFPEYTREQFIEAVIGVLTKREKVSKSLAKYIAEQTFNKLESKDVRQAVRIARIAKSKKEVDETIKTFSHYSGEFK